MNKLQRKAGGLSLVELMVAVAISLVILAALVALFVNTSRSNREFARANSMIENGRLAVQVLESDVIHAGYWGTYVPDFDNQTAADRSGRCADGHTGPVPRLRSGQLGRQLRQQSDRDPVQTYDDATVCAGIITDLLPDTDVLIVRHLEPCVPGGPSPNCDPVVVGKSVFPVHVVPHGRHRTRIRYSRFHAAAARLCDAGRRAPVHVQHLLRPRLCRHRRRRHTDTDALAVRSRGWRARTSAARTVDRGRRGISRRTRHRRFERDRRCGRLHG